MKSTIKYYNGSQEVDDIRLSTHAVETKKMTIDELKIWAKKQGFNIKDLKALQKRYNKLNKVCLYVKKL